MKLIKLNLIFLLLVVSCSKTVRTQLSEEVLNESYIGLNGDSKSFRSILEAHQGKQIVIDIWASWCRDCIEGLPALRALQTDKSDAVYIFLSADRDLETWKRSIKKYDIQGEHYFMPKGTKGVLGAFVDIDWIPRYMIVDANGRIELFEAIEADDPIIRNILK